MKHLKKFEMLKYKSIDNVKSEIANNFLFCDNPIINGVGVREDNGVEYVHVYTKDVEKAKLEIPENIDGYKITFEQSDGFKAY